MCPTSEERHRAYLHAHSHHHRSPAMPDEHIPLGYNTPPLLEDQQVPLNFARLHHVDIPNHNDSDYPHFQALQKVALINAAKFFEEELAARSPLVYIQVQNETLIIVAHSQSKLSQQELADLQKATHFDKKELQQWYKGENRHIA